MTLKLQVKLARRALRRTTARMRWGNLDAPVLFGNSFPKSGTHLLTQVLDGFTELGPAVQSGLPAVLTFDGPTGQPRPQNLILSELKRLLPGDIGYGHLHAEPAIQEALCRDGVAPFFILRDPRDVVVSHVYYVTDMASRHVHHDYYKSLPDFNARLKVSILGRPDAEHPFPDIRARFEPYLPWLSRLEVLTLRYRDFINQPHETLGKVYDHAVARGFPAHGTRDAAVLHLHNCIDPARSPTFRSGKLGGWRERFTDEHIAIFKQVSGDLLIQLGYETNGDW